MDIFIQSKDRGGAHEGRKGKNVYLIFSSKHIIRVPEVNHVFVFGLGGPQGKLMRDHGVPQIWYTGPFHGQGSDIHQVASTWELEAGRQGELRSAARGQHCGLVATLLLDNPHLGNPSIAPPNNRGGAGNEEDIARLQPADRSARLAARPITSDPIILRLQYPAGLSSTMKSQGG